MPWNSRRLRPHRRLSLQRALQPCCCFITVVGLAVASWGDVVPTIDRAEGNRPVSRFERVASPVADDLAESATFKLLGGKLDPGAGGLDVLHDGKLAGGIDAPAENCFLAPGTTGGRLLIDLGEAREIGQINTFSVHSGSRAPQVYTAFAASGAEARFRLDPGDYTDPAYVGWTRLARVDTRPRRGGDASGSRSDGSRSDGSRSSGGRSGGTRIGGTVAVSLNDPEQATLGKFRYVLLDIERTESDDPFGNTFYSEIDVISPAKVTHLKPAAPLANGEYRISVITTDLSPEMKEWAETKLKPVCQTWYPKIVKMLPSDGYHAPTTFTIRFRDDMGGTPAAAAGTSVMCNLPWFEKNKDGEAVGAVVHEMVHVVQQYKFGSKSTPFWLQEGIPDYIRWFLYEPEKNGARIRDIDKAKYDAAYRTSANFLNWATNKYDAQLVPKLNAVVRQGKYSDDLWKDLTKGKSLSDLEAEWKADLRKK